jgi:hypothetical protein
VNRREQWEEIKRKSPDLAEFLQELKRVFYPNKGKPELKSIKWKK